MIDEKTIDEGARDYINKNGYFIKYDEDPCVDIEFAYKEGAKWAIKEFLKDLWHEPEERPVEGKHVVTKSVDDGRYYYDIDNVSWLDPYRETWEVYCIINKIKAWCYIDDLLPKKGGKK